METKKPGRGVPGRAVMGLTVALLLGGCPTTDKPALWCGTLAVHEDFFVPGAGIVDQDFPSEQRCVPLVPCGDTRFALVLDPQEGRCTVLVDFPTPLEGSVLPGSHCETGRNRIGGPSRDEGLTLGGKVTLHDAGFEADIDWDVVIRTGEFTRIGATQHYAFRDAVQSLEPTKQDPEVACRDPEPPAGPEDFASVVGCSREDFVDRTDASAERIVRFGNDTGEAYAPRCMSIAVGQSVSFQGPFSTYPLSPGLPESIATGAPWTPLTNLFVGESREFTFSRAGDYIYSNSPRAAQGMSGMIRVR